MCTMQEARLRDRQRAKQFAPSSVAMAKPLAKRCGQKTALISTVVTRGGLFLLFTLFSSTCFTPSLSASSDDCRKCHSSVHGTRVDRLVLTHRMQKSEFAALHGCLAFANQGLLHKLHFLPPSTVPSGRKRKHKGFLRISPKTYFSHCPRTPHTQLLRGNVLLPFNSLYYC